MMSMMKKNASNDEDSLKKLRMEVEGLVKDVNASEILLQKYKKSAERDAVAVKNALEESKQAQADAKQAESKL